MDFSGKQVAVIGYGKSGKAALELLGKLGAKRILYDQKLDCNAPGIDAEVLVSGDFKEEGWDDVDCAVFSPGVPGSVFTAATMEKSATTPKRAA